MSDLQRKFDEESKKKSIQAEKELLRENLRLKKEIDTMVFDRATVEQVFTQLRDDTRREFQSIQREVHRLTNEFANSNVWNHISFALYFIGRPITSMLISN
jgi:hypothetical protein